MVLLAFYLFCSEIPSPPTDKYHENEVKLCSL